MMAGTEKEDIKLMGHFKDAHQNQEVLLVIKEIRIELWDVAPVVVGAQSNYSKSKSVNAWNEAQAGPTHARLQFSSIFVE